MIGTIIFFDYMIGTIIFLEVFVVYPGCIIYLSICKNQFCSTTYPSVYKFKRILVCRAGAAEILLLAFKFLYFLR